MKGPRERVIEAIEEIRKGRMVIVVDDEDRENEGDLCMAAETVTPEAIAFMATHGRGLICLALDPAQIKKLNLPMMVQDNQAPLGTAFTVSIEARHGVTTGISAGDRATTIRAAIDDDAGPDTIISPGHVFPLRARRGGVLVRIGQTEGSADLARLAGFKRAGVICEIMRTDGEMARMPDLEEFAREHDLKIVSIADLIQYRMQHEHIVQRRGAGQVRPDLLGEGDSFTAYLYGAEVEDTEYLALVRGDVGAASSAGEAVLVRVQSMCPVGDTFGIRPDLRASLEAIDEAGVGVFLYVYNQAQTSFRASFEKQVLQMPGPKRRAPGAKSEALRDFGLGAQVLADLGCRKIRLMSNSNRRIVGIEGFGIHIVERIPIPNVAERKPRLRPIDGGKHEHEEGQL